MQDQINALQNDVRELRKASADYNKIKEENERLKDQLKNLAAEQTNMAQVLEENPRLSKQTVVTEAAAELQDIESRKNNIAVFGLPETDNDMETFIDFANAYHILSAPLYTRRKLRAATE